MALEIRDPLYEFFNALRDYSDFEHKGFLSNKISLDYKIESAQPHLFFNCKENEKFSFKVHDLELGNTPEEAYFWHNASRREEIAQFKGFVSKLYPLIPDIRGILSVENEFHRLGLFIRDGRVIRKRTNEEMNEGTGIIFGNILAYVNTLGKIKQEQDPQQKN